MHYNFVVFHNYFPCALAALIGFIQFRLLLLDEIFEDSLNFDKKNEFNFQHFSIVPSFLCSLFFPSLTYLE